MKDITSGEKIDVGMYSLVYVSHKYQYLRISPRLSKVEIYNINHFNSHISHLLRNSSWDHKDPTHLWIQFKNIFNHASDLHAPVKTRKVRSTYAPWLTTEN